MSRLTEKLKGLSSTAAPAMGFRAAAASRGPSLLLLARIEASAGKRAADLAGAGADALLVYGSGVATFTGCPDASKTPCGALLHQDAEGLLQGLQKAGYDFLALSAGTAPAAWLRAEGMGKVLRVPADVDARDLRGVDHIGVDAVLLEPGDEPEFVSVQLLMTAHFLSEALRQPVLASLGPSATVDDVRALWEAGVSGVVVEGDGRRVKELRSFIDSLPARPRRKGRRDAALLPHVPGPGQHEEEEDE